MPIAIVWPVQPKPPKPDAEQARLLERLRSTRAAFVDAWRDYCLMAIERSTIVEELLWTVRALSQILARHGSECEAVAVDFLRTAPVVATKASWEEG